MEIVWPFCALNLKYIVLWARVWLLFFFFLCLFRSHQKHSGERHINHTRMDMDSVVEYKYIMYIYQHQRPNLEPGN